MLDISKYEYQKTDPFFQELSEIETDRRIDKDFVNALDRPYHYKAVAYVRVSTRKQVLKYSIPEQIKRAKDIAQREGWDLVGYYGDPGVSGKLTTRGDFNEMVNHAKQGKFDLIVVLFEDRFGRNFVEMIKIIDDLYKHRVQVVSLDRPIKVTDPRLIQESSSIPFELEQVFRHWKAQEDSKDLANKFNSGKYGKAQQGKIPVKTPYGYRKRIVYENGDPQKRQEVDEVVPEQAVVVRKIFNLYDKHSFGMRKIAEYLNNEEIPSPNGKTWCYSTIKYILQNPTYTGAIRWGWGLSNSKKSRSRYKAGHKGIIVEGKQEPIITKAQHLRVQVKIKRRSQKGGRAVASKGLLVGIARCGLCGGRTFVTKYPHWYAYTKSKYEREKYKETHAYFCSTYASRGKSACPRRYVMSQGKLEKLVLDEVCKLSRSKTARKAYIKEVRKNKVREIKLEIKQISNQLDKLEERDKRLREAYLGGKDTLEEYSRGKADNGEARNSLHNQLASKQLELTREEDFAEKNEQAILALADFEKVWAKATFEQKKDLLHTILSKIIVYKSSIKIEFATY